MKMTCSDCDEDILGTVVLVRDADPMSEEPMEWGMLTPHIGTTGTFVMLHPNCFKVFQDELLRQERVATLLVFFGSVAEVKMALETP